MPFLMSAEDAAKRIVKGLASRRFEITFPTRFAWIMNLLRIVPDAAFLAVARRMVASTQSSS